MVPMVTLEGYRLLKDGHGLQWPCACLRALGSARRAPLRSGPRGQQGRALRPLAAELFVTAPRWEIL